MSALYLVSKRLRNHSIRQLNHPIGKPPPRDPLFDLAVMAPPIWRPTTDLLFPYLPAARINLQCERRLCLRELEIGKLRVNLELLS
jgi:hypothetical protein